MLGKVRSVSLFGLLAAGAVGVAGAGCDTSAGPDGSGHGNLSGLPSLPGIGALPIPGLTLGNATGLSCASQTSPDGVFYTLCGGKVPSFDGTPIDLDITYPGDLTVRAPRPLVVFLHGLGNSKTEWESTTVANGSPDKSGYNNVAMAARGYASLNITSRGFHGSCGHDDIGTLLDPACLKGWIKLADRRFEIRDMKYLTGLVVDAGIANPRKVLVTGGSYGGGQSWLAALEGDQVTVADPTNVEFATLVPWRSPRGAAVHLVGAVPKYSWTDLVASLVPNGRQTDGTIPDGSRTSPAGVMKASFVTGLFSYTQIDGKDAPPLLDPSADLVTWYTTVVAGEPYVSPFIPVAFDELMKWRSPFYQDDLIDAAVANHTEVPVLDLRGWTDQLFPALEGVSFYNKLKAADPRWPVGLYLADVGHQAAQNKSADWTTLNAQANSFIDARFEGFHVPLGVGGRVTTCDGSAGAVYSARTWSDLTTATRDFAASGDQTATFAPGDVVNGLLADPVASQTLKPGCITESASDPTLDAAIYSFPVDQAFVMFGVPTVRISATVDGKAPEIAARLWDVGPDGTRTLVTRGVYRAPDALGAASLAFQLQGNAWSFAAGHQVRLEVLGQDAPYYRPSNLPATFTIHQMQLSLPAR